jgi:hypothetical protein
MVEHARVQAEHDRRQRLDDPDPAEQLQLDRIRERQPRMNATAPTFTISDTSFATCVSWWCVMLRLTNSRWMLRV